MKSIFKAWLGICLSAMLLLGCGGGGDPVAGVGSGGTGAGGGGTDSGKSYVAGVITSSGTDIVVNGIHFETGGADVRDARTDTLLLPSMLKPGMMVEIEASKVEVLRDRSVAKATRIRIAGQVQGTILQITRDETFPERVTALNVLGMQVHVLPETRVDLATLPDGLAQLKMFDVVEVHGFLDAVTGRLVATYVSRKVGTDAELFFLQGQVVNLIPDEKAFQMAGLPFVWQTQLVEKLEGYIVEVQFNASLLSRIEEPDFSYQDLLLAVSVMIQAPDVEGQRDAYIDGLVSYADPVKRKEFRINNVFVDANKITCSACADLLPGDRVRVRGSLMERTVQASSVELITVLER